MRFSSAVGRGELQDGKELGEHSLLDLDVTSSPEVTTLSGVTAPSGVTTPSGGGPETVREDVSRDSEDDGQCLPVSPLREDRKSTRLNSSH